MKASDKKEVKIEEVTEEEVERIMNEPICEVNDWLWERGINPEHAVRAILGRIREITRPN